MAPLQYASGYTLDLYCDREDIEPWNHGYTQTFIGETFTDCVKQAKAIGWKVHRATRTATCPLCRKNT